jgi:hypothetical protein
MQMINASSSIKTEYYDHTVWGNEQGSLHRADGPAVVWNNGTKEWWNNNKRHELDGPAVEWANGYIEWWVNNRHVCIY